ncbi:phage minor capsid protein [Ornithinibacillus sp. JPR2-1]|uniref:phage minor capsid protein n=1 Tax=Ornithinibacillus sp. JPR2-1 TaxID=2094019 RepID=UPI0031DCFA3B
MRNPSSPNFDINVAILVKQYKRAAEDIMREIERREVTSLYGANARAALSDIADIIVDLDKSSEEWVKQNIPESARKGVARSFLTLGVVDTLQEAEKIVNFNKINREMVRAAVQDTYQDLANVTQNMDRKTKAGLRRIFSETMREQYTQGVMGVRTIKREALNRMYKEMEGLVNTGIIDAAGRKWKPETYVETITLEKMNQAYFEANINESISRGAVYGVISSHGATDACRYHEGRIVKLVDNAPGDYPTIDQLKATKQIFHVRCKHQVNTLRDLSKLPQSVLKHAQEQAERGNEAIAAGGRNPKIG